MVISLTGNMISVFELGSAGYIFISHYKTEGLISFSVETEGPSVSPCSVQLLRA